MARWVAIFRDNPKSDCDWIRDKHAEEHFEYLKANSEKIVLAGGLRPSAEEWFCGGLWILDVESREEADWLCQNDPYYKLGLRDQYELFVWGKAPCYGEITL